MVKYKKVSHKNNWLVVEPTHLTNISQNGFIFPNKRLTLEMVSFASVEPSKKL